MSIAAAQAAGKQIKAEPAFGAGPVNDNQSGIAQMEKSQEVETMKKLLIIIGAICYVVAPDLFFGPVDDAVVFLGSIIYAMAAPGANRNRDPEYIRMDRDF